jgi:thioredoxin reductase
VVVGGGDAAADAALVLAGFCSQVTVVHRGGELKAAYALVERLNRDSIEPPNNCRERGIRHDWSDCRERTVRGRTQDRSGRPCRG